MSFIQKVRIPVDRVGTLIGKHGTTRTWIEKKCNVKLLIDSESGEVSIVSDERPIEFDFQIPKKLVIAISRGFSKTRASSLLNSDNIITVLDLRHYGAKSSSSVSRLKGRIIGEKGKSRRVIEELTNTDLSVYGHTISIIGSDEDVRRAEDAINVLLKGGQHKTAYSLLQKQRRAIKIENLQLWEDN